MIRVLVVDDEMLARERLKRLLADVPGYVVCGEAGNGADALAKCQRLEPDIVLMDIRMPEMDGLAAAERLLQFSQPPAVIFCTAYDQYAVAAFQVQALGYLLKPVRREALARALAQAGRLNRAQLTGLRRRMQGEVEAQAPRSLRVRTHRGLELIEVDEIFYLMADQKYVTVHYTGGEVLVDESLRELEQQLAPAFLRVHRNALVNPRFVEALRKDAQGGYVVVLKGVEQPVAVSRRLLPQVRAFLEGDEVSFR